MNEQKDIKVRYELNEEQFNQFEKQLDEHSKENNIVLEKLLNRPKRWEE